MKPLSARLLASAVLIIATQAGLKAGDSAGSQVSRMMERLRQQGYQGVRQLKPPQASIPRRRSFYERALILGEPGGVMHAIVPLGSVLHLPDHLRDRVLSKPQGKLVAWETLFKNSKNWLGTQEISRAAARGEGHEIDVLTAQLASERRIIIAVNQARPVPVLQPSEAQSPKMGEAAQTNLNSQ
jgi:hypothetical protein